jgi:hypothetical protein
MKTRIIFSMLIILIASVSGKQKPEIFSQLNYGIKNTGTSFTIQLEKGKEHNHPLFAIWLADENGKYIQTLYVSESIGLGVFKRANRKTGKWLAGEIQRPATLPYWAHQRGIKNAFGTYMPTPKQPELDANTGATPTASFIMNVKSDKTFFGKFKVMLELNQSWDWNEYWTNDLYPNDKEYKTSSQPALIYSVDIDTNKPLSEYIMQPIGHSHYAGADGSITKDSKTITTALQIAKKITVKVN